jgi:hypothetical protein
MLDTFENLWLKFLRYECRISNSVRWGGLPSESVTYELFCRELRVPRIKTEGSQLLGYGEP